MATVAPPESVLAGAGPQDVAGLVLTPGAGAGRDNRTLVAVDRALAPLPVRRVNFPNRDAGKGGVDRPEAAIARIVEQAQLLADELGVGTDRIAVGGRSFGGRMSSMAVAQGLKAAALVLLSYPLHPPGRPERLRVEHLPDVAVPVLAVSGRRDAFGTPDELATHLATVAGPLTLVLVDGDHSPKDDAGVAATVRHWLTPDVTHETP